MDSSDGSFRMDVAGDAAVGRDTSNSVPPPGFRAPAAPVVTPVLSEYAAPAGAPPLGAAPSSPARGNIGGAGASLLQRNPITVRALCVVALYIAIALSTRVVLLGVFPVMLSVRAAQRKEPLAPLAFIAAAVAVIIAVVAISGH